LADGDDGAVEVEGEGAGEAGDAESEVVGTAEEGSAAGATALE